jgi:hypothetical protein
MKINPLWLRSVRGQLTLLGLAYAGAVALAIAALCTRSIFFERFIGESYKTASEELAVLLQAAAEGNADQHQLARLKDANPDVLYEAWMGDDRLDRDGKLARYLFSVHGEVILDRARRTLALGTVAQRLRALDLLGWVELVELRPEAARLCRFALERARRRDEAELADRAGRLLTRLGA